MRSFALMMLALATALPLRAQEAPDAPIPYTTINPAPEAPKTVAPHPQPVRKPPPPQAPPPPGPAPLAAAELAAFVDGYVAEAMRRQHIAGVVVAVVQNGQIVLKKGYGFARLQPRQAVDPDRTLFRLGAVSQALTWVAVMRQVEAGRIRLEQPVNLYLPEPVQVRDNGFEQPVRMLDLMAHAGGFEVRGFGPGVEEDAEYVRPLELYLRRERPRRVRPPGQTATVSAYGPALAGAAVARVSGKPFEQAMEEQVLRPLDLRRTTFREPRPAKPGLPAPMPAALAAEAAQPYRWRDGAFVRQPYEFAGQVAPAGSASSTAADMARLMLALLGDGRLDGVTLYGPRTARALRTPILPAPAGVNGWAHGFAVESLAGARSGYGLGGGALSSAAHLVTVPELNLGVFVAANSVSGERLAGDLPGAIARRFYGPPAIFPPSPARAADRRGSYAGHYLTTARAYAGLQGFVGRLLGEVEVGVAPDGRLLTRSLGHGRRSWIAEAAPGRFVGENGESRLVFEPGGGEARAFVRGDGAARFERVGFWRSQAALGLFAGLAAAAALTTLAGAALRNRKERRETQIQSRAGLVQNIQAGLWLVSMGLGVAWFVRNADPARLVFGWPSPLLVTASACALVAGALTITTMVALPSVWQGGRRVDSWSPLRKLGFSLRALIYAVFATLLALGGALSPWSS
jgi:CubicO group peptidase (beta-lactamase class C family)